MKLLSKQGARKVWYVLSAFHAVQAAAFFGVASHLYGGMLAGDINALACLIAGAAVTFGMLAITDPGAKLPTRVNRYLLAVLAGTACNVIVTWGLWAYGTPIMNGTVRRGLMGENYWLGPAILAYAVIVWLFYRAGVAKEASQQQRRMY